MTEISLRCTRCDERYPVRPEFRVCPDCKQETGRVQRAPTVDPDAAIKRAAFERFYAERGRRAA